MTTDQAADIRRIQEEVKKARAKKSKPKPAVAKPGPAPRIKPEHQKMKVAEGVFDIRGLGKAAKPLLKKLTKKKPPKLAPPPKRKPKIQLPKIKVDRNLKPKPKPAPSKLTAADRARIQRSLDHLPQSQQIDTLEKLKRMGAINFRQLPGGPAQAARDANKIQSAAAKLKKAKAKMESR